MSAASKTFALKRPCKNCPFRTDVHPYLRRGRAIEIATAIAGGDIFPCHETTVTDPDDEANNIATSKSAFCAGALIVMEKQDAPNQAMRTAERVGLYEHERLDMDAPVVGSLIEFVNHHDPEDEEAEDTTCHVSNQGCEAPAGMMVGNVAVPVEPEGEVHMCEQCGQPVCGSCSNEAGLCFYCADEEG